MTKLVFDPITRIEGHLRVEVQVDGGKVTDAWVSGTMWRGIEKILKGRDPRECWAITSRICGVCTTVHSTSSVRAVEDALGIDIPDNARVIRNIITAAQFVQDHVIHFYHLHALDWVDVVSSLKADAAQTASLAQSLSPWPNATAGYYKGVQDRIRTLVQSGQLGLFANGYWGHPAFKLPPEVNLMAVAHYLEALKWQRDVIAIHALLGAKNPHPQTFLVGGMATPIDPNSQNAINAHTLATLKSLAEEALEFVKHVYLPDLLAIASFYKNWASIGAGVGNYLSYGEFPRDSVHNSTNTWLPSGFIRFKNIGAIEPVDQKKVAEDVLRAWYSYTGGDGIPKHPYDGETTPNYTGPTPPYEFLETDRKYSWVKAISYDGVPAEVGPLARMLVAYANGHKRVRELVGLVLAKLGVGVESLFSTLGRTAARGIETLAVAEMLPVWIDELVANIKGGDYRIHNGEKWEPNTWPAEARGFGFHEAPRGALCHWIVIKDKKVANYQCVVPSGWNASPRDVADRRGPYEEALVGTPVEDAEKPLEILRTIHSFDPCMACAVHLINKTGKELSVIGVR
ncbi:MAG: nickel-dependent hydrogenase large subunit [Nitrospirae bacterium]|nr:nickel-dependent hydrogenase large subunit [Nitrospirota bacterium]